MFLFYWSLLLLWVLDVGFQITCAVSGNWISPGLFQDFMDVFIKTLKILYPPHKWLCFGYALIVGGWGVLRWWFLFSASWNFIFFQPGFNRSSKLDIFWHVSTGYFYVKNLGRPFSAITFTVNSHADNHFYKYIYLYIQIQIWMFYTILHVVHTWHHMQSELTK